jgi:chromosome segregation ATPase
MATISDRIQTADQAVRTLGDNFTGAFQGTTMSTNNFVDAFRIEMGALVEARGQYVAERGRVQQQIEEIQRSIINAQAQITQAQANMNSAGGNINALMSQRNVAANQADGYRRQMNNASDDSAREEARRQMQVAVRNANETSAAIRANQVQQENARNQLNAASSSLRSFQGERTNLERRVEQLTAIINMF